MEPDASKGASSSSLNKSNEENIDPTYQIPADGDHSDEDVFAAVTPSKPSTSGGRADGGLPGEKNLTPLTRSEKGIILWIWENTCIIYWYIVISACLIYSLFMLKEKGNRFWTDLYKYASNDAQQDYWLKPKGSIEEPEVLIHVEMIINLKAQTTCMKFISWTQNGNENCNLCF